MFTPPERTTIEVEGCDGEWFTVAGDDQWDRGIALADEDTGTDFGGMYEPAISVIYNSTAYQIGATYGGMREDKFDFILAFHVKGTPERPWRYCDSDFRKAWSAKRDSKIWVEVEDSRRWLTVRLGGKVKIKAINDPNGEQYGLVLVPLIAAYPRWLEEDVVSSYITATDTTGGGTETGVLYVSNPLPPDYPIWPKYVAQGTTGIVWTIDDRSWGNDEFERATIDAARKIVMPPLIAGENILIDTNPQALEGQVNSSLDTEVYQRMGGKRFMYSIPGPTPKTNIGVSVTHAPVGAGIQVKCPREWPRPWGLEP